MNQAGQRALLRWIHLVLTIPLLGYIYGPPAEVRQYAAFARFGAVPIIMFSGYWMYAGWVFAFLGLALWLGLYLLTGGIGASILSQAALFIARAVWLKFRRRPAP